MLHKESYPMRGGLFVPPTELDLPPSRLDLTRKKNVNNHHLSFTARQMGRLLITQTFRDLERNQVLLPVDVHDHLHQVYDPPELPDLTIVFDAIDDAYQNNERLRYGAAHHPLYKPISLALVNAIAVEYGAVA